MNDEEQATGQEQLKRTVLKKILSKEASERLSRIKLVKPEMAAQLENYLAELFQAGKIKTEISEQQMIMILEALTQKREFKILK